MVRIHTWKGDTHFGPLLDDSENAVSIFDIAAATTVNLEDSAIKSRIDQIDEIAAGTYVPFASYAAWKLGKILKTGRLEATVVHNSEKGVFVNRGSGDGVETGRRCVLLGDPEKIVDPTTDEVLGVIREQLGKAIPLTVVSERLSKLNFPEPANADAQTLVDAYAAKRQVEIEQQPKRIVLAPPRWKPTADAESLTDDANFLHAHLIAELVRYGFTIVSKKQTELMRQSIADERRIEVADVPDIEIAKGAKADVLVSVDMLAKGITCQVQLQVTDLATDEYLGIVSGSTRRKEQKVESARAIAFAKGVLAGKRLGIRVNASVVSLVALADSVTFDDKGDIWSFKWTKKPMTRKLFELLCSLESIKDLRLDNTPLDDKGLRMLTGLSRIQYLGISGTRVSNRGCKTLAENFPRLTHVNMQNCKRVTSTGTKHLAEKKSLKVIRLAFTGVDDRGLEQLSTLPNLEKIYFYKCNVSDWGLAQFLGCKTLRELGVQKTNVSRNGVQKAKAALPDCDILSDF